jgi:hypothetical protein
MQANADGTLKKGAGKLPKENTKDTLGKKEKGTKTPKGVKIMTMIPKKSKGVKVMDIPGKEKKIKLKETINKLLKEGFDKETVLKYVKEAVALKDKAGNIQYAKDDAEASNIQNQARTKNVILTKTKVNENEDLDNIINGDSDLEIGPEKRKRYTLAIDFYIYANDDNEANQKSEKIKEWFDKNFDNQPQILSLDYTPFASMISKKLREIEHFDPMAYQNDSMNQLDQPLYDKQFPIRITDEQKRYNFLYKYYKPKWDAGQLEGAKNEFKTLDKWIKSLNKNNVPEYDSSIFDLDFPFFVEKDGKGLKTMKTLKENNINRNE